MKVRELVGQVFEKPLQNRETRDWHRDDEGEILYYTFIRTLNGQTFSAFRRDVRTPGLFTLGDGQRALFEPDDRVARNIRRLLTDPNPCWGRVAEEIRASNGRSGWLKARMDFFDPYRGFGFAVLDVNGNRVFMHVTKIIKRDREDDPSLTSGMEVFVQLGEAPKKAGQAPAASRIICVEG